MKKKKEEKERKKERKEKKEKKKSCPDFRGGVKKTKARP